MPRICVLDINTKICINVLELANESDWQDHAHFARAPRDDGQVGWTLLPSGEWDDHQTVPDLEQRRRYQRGKRDKYLTLNVDKYNAVRWLALTQSQQEFIIAYRQALLDVPQQSGFPDDIVWPQHPDF